MIITETEQLIIQEIVDEDAPFILNLLNTPSWITFIGDREIRTEVAARNFINDRLRKSYIENGFGFYLTKLKFTDIPIGICGLVK
nr:hypothetical protein [Bacteroidota bacterium]